MAIITVTEVEDGKVKSVSITASNPEDVQVQQPEEHYEAGDTIFIPMDELDKFNQECNETLLNNEGVKNFIIKNVFVFGSNTAGRHGKGAALYARQHHGAIYGQGVGLQGNSYAIPTKDANIMALPLETIKKHVADFIEFAKQHPEMQFNVTAIGCGLAGYKPEQIAPMFKDAPDNCILPDEFKEALGDLDEI